MMKKLYLIHTIGNYKDIIYDPFAVPFKEENPHIEIYNISDDSLLKETLDEGRVTKKVYARILNYAKSAEFSGADAIMVTCTSVNEVTKYAKKFIQVPLLNIDEPAAEKTVSAGKRIGILATLPTSPIATKRLLFEEAKRMNKEIEIVVRVAEGAFDVLCRGDRDKHDDIVNKELKKLAAEVDTIAFAQISMSLVKHEELDIPVFKIGKSGFNRVKKLLNEKGD